LAGKLIAVSVFTARATLLLLVLIVALLLLAVFFAVIGFVEGFALGCAGT
jgi:hypothetical protein